MKAVYMLSNRQEQQKRFGNPGYLFARQSPKSLTEACWEVPIGTVPIVRLPFHSTFVFQLGLPYFRLGLRANRLLRRKMVYLFHAIDILDGRHTGELADRVAVLRKPVEERHRIVSSILDSLAEDTVVTTTQWVCSQRPG